MSVSNSARRQHSEDRNASSENGMQLWRVAKDSPTLAVLRARAAQAHSARESNSFVLTKSIYMRMPAVWS